MSNSNIEIPVTKGKVVTGFGFLRSRFNSTLLSVNRRVTGHSKMNKFFAHVVLNFAKEIGFEDYERS